MAFRLRQITSREEIDFNHSLNFKEWGMGLTIDKYIEREIHLGSQSSCANDGIKFWSYERQDADTGAWIVVSCCETLTRPAMYKVKGVPVRDTTSISIGAVFTPTEHRGKGYAKVMLDLVVEKVDEEEGTFKQYEQLSSDAVAHSFSVLWSDVGYYYNKFGYTLTDNRELVFPVPQVASEEETVIAPHKFIEEADIEDFAVRDTAQFVRDLDTWTEADGITRVAITPSAHVHELTHARVTFLAPLLRPNEHAAIHTVHYGAQHAGVTLLWSQDFGNNKLNILRVYSDREFALDSEDEEAFLNTLTVLLQASAREARRWNLKKVTLWRQDLPGSDIVKAELLEKVVARVKADLKYDAKLEDRDGSWPMVRFWKGQTTLANGTEKVKLVNDGKYAWF
ncbi:hypothetical protein D0Z03_002026 [Geotrichum reessii]|nr:hypothetical protein D0Z03_002026 [Galactomyces reessii]